MSAYEKLNDDATGSGHNLDQVLYFGLQEQIIEICKQRAQEFSEFGVTVEDVLNEIRCVLDNENETIIEEVQSDTDNQSINSILRRKT